MKSLFTLLTFILVFVAPSVAEENKPVSLTYVEQKRIEQLVLTQYYRWFHLFERPSSEQRIQNHLAILDEQVQIKTFQGEMAGHPGMRGFYQAVSGWQNTHHIHQTKVTALANNEVSFEADIVYQNILPNGERNNFALHYVTHLTLQDNALPVFNALDLQFRGPVEPQEFKDAYVNNRVYSYLYYLLAYLNGSVDDVAARQTLFAKQTRKAQQNMVAQIQSSLGEEAVLVLGDVAFVFNAEKQDEWQVTFEIQQRDENNELIDSSQWKMQLHNDNEQAFLLATNVTSSHNLHSTYQNKVAAYLALWEITSASEREKALRAIWTSSSIHENPFNHSVGFAPLLAEIEAFQRNMPNHVLQIRSFKVSQKSVLISLDLLSPTGENILPGFDYIEFDESGKIQRVVGFF